MNELIGIGYWRSLYHPTLPDPAKFVNNSWPIIVRQSIADYLNQGRKLHYWMGYSWCRFRCSTGTAQMGACDVTDGTYCWPEGLSHYILHHAVSLPNQVVQHILAQSSFPHEQAAQVLEASNINLDYWSSQQGYHPAAESFLSENDQEIHALLRRYDQGKLFFEDYTEDGLRAVIRLVQELKNRPTI